MPFTIAEHIDPSFNSTTAFSADINIDTLRNAAGLVAREYEFEDPIAAVNLANAHAKYQAVRMLTERYKQLAEQEKQTRENNLQPLAIKVRQGDILSPEDSQRFANESVQIAALEEYITAVKDLDTGNKFPQSLSTSSLIRNPLELLVELLAYREVCMHFPDDAQLKAQYKTLCEAFEERLADDNQGFFATGKQKVRYAALVGLIMDLKNPQRSIFSLLSIAPQCTLDLKTQYEQALSARSTVVVNWQNAKSSFPVQFPSVPLSELIAKVRKYAQTMDDNVDISSPDIYQNLQAKLKEVTKQAHELTFELTDTSSEEEKKEVYEVLTELYEASCKYWNALVWDMRNVEISRDPLKLHQQLCSQAIFAPYCSRFPRAVNVHQIAMIEDVTALEIHVRSDDKDIKSAAQYRKLQLMSQAITKGQVPQLAISKDDYTEVHADALTAIHQQVIAYHRNIFTRALAMAVDINAIDQACGVVCASVGTYLSQFDKKVREKMLALLGKEANEAKDQLVIPAHIKNINAATTPQAVNRYFSGLKFFSDKGKAEIVQCAKQKRWALFKIALINSMVAEGDIAAARLRVQRMALKEWVDTENISDSSKEIFEREITTTYASVYNDSLTFKLDEAITQNTVQSYLEFWNILISFANNLLTPPVTQSTKQKLWDNFVVPQEAAGRIGVDAITDAPDIITKDTIEFIETHLLGSLSQFDEEFLAQTVSPDLLLHQKLRILCGINIAPTKRQEDKLEYTLSLYNTLSTKLDTSDNLTVQQLDVLLQAVKRYYPESKILNGQINTKLMQTLLVSHPGLIAVQWAVYILSSIDKTTDKDLKIFLTDLSAVINLASNIKELKNAILLALINELEKRETDINKVYKLFNLFNPNLSAQSHHQQTLKVMMKSSGAWDEALQLLRAKGAILKLSNGHSQFNKLSEIEEDLLFNSHRNLGMGVTTTADILAGNKPLRLLMWERAHAGKQTEAFFQERYDECAKTYRNSMSVQ
ncbi:MAG: hypothetical protein ABSF18_02145 [Gammaproteobacteria bacterium]|jgi:hypothetical protein